MKTVVNPRARRSVIERVLRDDDEQGFAAVDVPAHGRPFASVRSMRTGPVNRRVSVVVYLPEAGQRVGLGGQPHNGR
jgi:hypothetical protein